MTFLLFQEDRSVGRKCLIYLSDRSGTIFAITLLKGEMLWLNIVLQEAAAS